jgi:hypothetical protein
MLKPVFFPQFMVLIGQGGLGLLSSLCFSLFSSYSCSFVFSLQLVIGKVKKLVFVQLISHLLLWIGFLEASNGAVNPIPGGAENGGSSGTGGTYHAVRTGGSGGMCLLFILIFDLACDSTTFFVLCILYFQVA